MPLKVAGDTTIGELLGDPRTAQVVQQMMAEAEKNSPFAQTSAGKEESESDKLMMQEMMAAMPLKSLISFGMITLSDMEKLIKTLNQLL